MSKNKNNARNSKESDNLSFCTSSSMSSDEEEIDAKDLKPIKEYLSDRRELGRQLFKSVKPEKIRMMLPQVLKKIDLSELEELCVNELTGMSKARINSILTGKPMLESSDTSESNDSGPSLEIISDTEEWTDDDASKKGHSKGRTRKDKTKTKGKAQATGRNNLNKSTIKTNIKNEVNDKAKDIKIKMEDDKDKGREGDSLLDLLELEMRARVIRALIQKEEDIIPSSNPSQANEQTAKSNLASSQDDDKAKENCRKQLERIISAQQSNNKSEDEDVVLVVPPTPVVELLSSDSDKEDLDGARKMKRLEDVRATDTGEAASSTSDEAMRSSGKNSLHDSKEKKATQEALGKRTDSNTKIDPSTKSEAKLLMPERNVGIKNNTLSISISAENVAEKRRRSKKRSQRQSAKLQAVPSAAGGSPRSKQLDIIETIEESSDGKNQDNKGQSKEGTSPADETEAAAKEKDQSSEKAAERSGIEEDQLASLDEIIDLDDYCDVMEIVSGDDETSQDQTIATSQQGNEQPGETSQAAEASSKAESTETWASRYYQTDDVQNVIKESKIQSEIRKRLRERQRLSKLSKSPNLNVPTAQPATVDGTSAVPEKVPTGSVEEYLALKRAGTTNVSANDTTVNNNNNNNNNNDNNNDTTPNSSDNNDSTQDNSTTVNSSSDFNVNSEQSENISTVEGTNNTNDVDETVVSETAIAQMPEAVTETKIDAEPEPECNA